ncbi:MAG: hypothetical protein ACRES8_08625 [Nevskiaceae bacterium]
MLLDFLRPQPAQPPAPRAPLKGDYNGHCQRLACDCAGAHWFNTSNGRYYCSTCARAFNEVLRQQGLRAICELHLSR